MVAPLARRPWRRAWPGAHPCAASSPPLSLPSRSPLPARAHQRPVRRTSECPRTSEPDNSVRAVVRLGKHLFDGRKKAAALRGDALIGAARLLRGLQCSISVRLTNFWPKVDGRLHAPSAAHGHCRQLPTPRAPACPSAHSTATAARRQRSTNPAPAPPSLGAHCSGPLGPLSPRAPQQTPAPRPHITLQRRVVQPEQ